MDFDFGDIPQWAIKMPTCGTIHKDNIILCCVCESDLFMPFYIRSLYKKLKPQDFTLILWDNSGWTPMNVEVFSNYGYDNILYFNNIKNWSNNNTRNILDFKWIDEQTTIGSASHSYTIQYVIDLLIKNGRSNLILTDSDVIFRKNPLEMIDGKYITIGCFESARNRLHPCCQYINLNKVKEYGLKFFDEKRIYGLNGNNNWTLFDTGYSFFMDCLNHKDETLVLNELYVDHFGCGTYAYNSEEPQFNTKDPKDKPQNSWNMIWNWVTENRQFWM